MDGNGAQPEEEKTQEPAVDPKKAIREKAVVCLECGKKLKVLSKKHLAQHGLTPEEYKEKWGFKKNQSLVTKELTRQRKQKMQDMQLWKRRDTGKKTI
ncbi:MAG: MucR family transcriptional regulator [Desulfovermiculus sp.]